MTSETACVTARLPVEEVEIRPGRHIAVHHQLPGGGKGKQRLIFVHGSCASMLQFEPMISHFAQAGHEVVAYDFVGCGRSPKPRLWHAYAFSELASDLAAVVSKYGADQENVLVCHSAGCWLGLGLVESAVGSGQKAPAGLCLMGAGLLGRRAVPPIFYLPETLLGWMQPSLSAGFEAMALHQKTRDGATEARRLAHALAKEVNASNPPHMFKAYYRQLVAPDERAVRAAGESVPIVLVVGDGDRVMPRAATDALHALLPPTTPIRVVPDASHQHMQEEPAVCVKILADFLDSL